MMDTFQRLNSNEDDFFVPYDNEYSHKVGCSMFLGSMGSLFSFFFFFFFFFSFLFLSSFCPFLILASTHAWANEIVNHLGAAVNCEKSRGLAGTEG